MFEIALLGGLLYYGFFPERGWEALQIPLLVGGVQFAFTAQRNDWLGLHAFNRQTEEGIADALRRGDREAAFAYYVKGGFAYDNDAGRVKFEAAFPRRQPLAAK